MYGNFGEWFGRKFATNRTVTNNTNKYNLVIPRYLFTLFAPFVAASLFFGLTPMDNA